MRKSNLAFLLVFLPIFLVSLLQAGTCVNGSMWDGNGGPFTLNGSPYLVYGSVIVVPDGETLTIQEGVVVMLRTVNGIGGYISVSGRLVANGAKFTGLKDYNFTECSGLEDTTRGIWGGLSFTEPDSGSRLIGCTIVNGGKSGSLISMVGQGSSPNAPNLKITGCRIEHGAGIGVWLNTFASPHIINTVIRDNADVGLYEISNSCDPVVSGCTFENNGDYPIVCAADNVRNYSNLYISGNTPDAIWVSSEFVDSGFWENHRVPYHVSFNLSSGAVAIRDGETLNIEAGTEIRFGPGRGFNVFGSLVAEGDSCNHIIFTKKDTAAATDHWGQINFNECDPGTILNYCDLIEGGLAGNSQAITIDDVQANLVISNCTISGSNDKGMHIFGNSQPVIFNNMFFGNAGYAIRKQGSLSIPQLRGNLFENNFGGIYNSSGSINLGMPDNPGHNTFLNSAEYAFKNTSFDSIPATGNYWSMTDSAGIDTLFIFDDDESGTAGPVVFTPFDSSDKSRPPQTVSCPPECEALTIDITAPTTNPIFTSTAPFLSLRGTAQDDHAVARVRWENSANGQQGLAQLGAPRNDLQWTMNPIQLEMGINIITVTAEDGDGCISSDQLTVERNQVPVDSCWLYDDFENIPIGSLDGQNGWYTVPTRSSAQVIANLSGSGQVLLLDAGSGETVIMGKDVPDQSSGIRELELMVLVEPGDTTLAKMEINTDQNPNWDKKFQLYFGAHMRLNYGPTPPEAIVYLPRTEPYRWYHVRSVIDLESNRVDLFLDGVEVLNGISIGPGRISEVSVSAWDLTGYVLFDDIHGCKPAVITGLPNNKNGTAANTFSLKQNYPNPFNPQTTIGFTLAQQERVTLAIFNLLGQRIATLVNRVLPIGAYQFNWKTDNVPGGIYFYRIHTASGRSFTRKMLLLR